MTYWDRKLLREQLDKKLEALKIWRDSGASEIGWVKAIRKALGMSTADMAHQVGIDQSRISRIENAEMAGNVKLSTMKKIAEGMDMDFVYGFVPRTSLEDMVRQQAKKIAFERISRIHHTMSLEMQEVTPEEQETALKDMLDQILINSPKDFWKQ